MTISLPQNRIPREIAGERESSHEETTNGMEGMWMGWRLPSVGHCGGDASRDNFLVVLWSRSLDTLYFYVRTGFQSAHSPSRLICRTQGYVTVGLVCITLCLLRCCSCTAACSDMCGCQKQPLLWPFLVEKFYRDRHLWSFPSQWIQAIAFKLEFRFFPCRNPDFFGFPVEFQY